MNLSSAEGIVTEPIFTGAFSEGEDDLYDQAEGGTPVTSGKRPRISPGTTREMMQPSLGLPRGGLRRLEVTIGALRAYVNVKVSKKKSGTLEDLKSIVEDLRVCADEIRERDSFLLGVVASQTQLREVVREEFSALLGSGDPTYSQVAAKRVPNVNLASLAEGGLEPQTRANVVAVYPKTNERGQPEKTSADTKRQVFQALQPRRDQLRVMNVREVRNVGAIMVTADKEAANKILNSEGLRDTGLTVTRPRSRMPKVMIYDVPKDISEADVIDAMYEQTLEMRPPSLDIVKQNMKVVKRIPRKEGGQAEHWVVECSPVVRNWLRHSDRVYVEFTSCRTKDYASVTRCYECQAYGHSSRYCKNKARCSHCSAEHGVKDCPSRDQRFPFSACKIFNKDNQHAVTSRDCPVYIKALEGSVRRTDYGI